MPKLTQKRLRSLLHYDPKTGLFRWRIAQSYCIKVGQRAGRLNGQGYINIQIDGATYLGHRLAWLYVHGTLPKQIEHKNRIRHQNWIKNLRPSTQTQNQANRAKLSGTSSRFKGVTWNKRCIKWQASIKLHGKSYHLGLFDEEGAAHKAYRRAATNLFGEFARMS